jgi:hypothetical protein
MATAWLLGAKADAKVLYNKACHEKRRGRVPATGENAGPLALSSALGSCAGVPSCCLE